MTHDLTNEPSWQEHVDVERRRRESPWSGPHPGLVPDLDLPVGDVATYRTLSITSLPLAATAPQELTAPLDILSGQRRHADAPTEGVLLTHEQGWRMRGVTLGRLLHSMTLAPGEVTQVAVTGWQRTSHGQTAEDVAEHELASQQAGRQRAVHDVVSGVSAETQFGMSTTAASSSQVDAGGSFLGISGGASSNTASGSTVQFSLGSRSASSDSSQKVRERTQQHAANQRGRRATVVQEVGSSETEQFHTRVVANYNHQHALNLLYYEVLEVFALSTQVTDAQRCIFLPMEILPFDEHNVVHFADPLADAARRMGLAAMAGRLDTIADDAEVARARLAHVQTQLNRDTTTRDRLRDERDVAVDHAQVSLDRRDRLVEDVRATTEEVRTLRRLLDALQADAGIFGSISNAFEDLGTEIADLIDTNTTHVGGSQHSRTRVALQAAEARLATQQAQLAAAHVVLADAEHKRGTAEAAFRLAMTAAEHSQAALDREEEAMVHVAADVVHQLNERQLAFNQALWMAMNPAQVAAVLHGKVQDGQPLVTTVDPTPLAVSGNLVAFRWGFAPDQADAAESFRRRHLNAPSQDRSEEQTVVLPTGGVFAEAVPGAANSAEKLDLTRFWKWDADTIPILPTAIQHLHQQRHATLAELKARQLDAPAATTSANLPPPPPPPGHVLAQAVSTQMFRDLSGSAVIGPLVKAAQQATKDGSHERQLEAHKNISAFLDHVEEVAPQVLQMLKSAGNSGGEGGSGMDPSNIGALKNALGGSGAEGTAGEAGEAGEAAAGEAGAAGAGLDVGALLAEAAELGLFL